MTRLVAVTAAVVLGTALSIDNGLGRTPPMGWRSWNLFGANVNDAIMRGQMAAMVGYKAPIWNGTSMSLFEIGMTDVGLDDNWQACGKGNKYSYHDDSGNPIVNTDRFPDFAAYTAYAHSLGLTAGWYGNNCICSEKTVIDGMYVGDVAAFRKFGFDSWKLDGCGQERDLDRFQTLIAATGKPV